jgi:glyoxylase-like metal-dependent hydrolase (beta-lactamase superfamily II)/ferredoxin
MARPGKRLATNVDGDLYVDSTCIDCDTCRWMAPATFDRAGEASRVHSQPEDPAALRQALEALISCPTGSIGTESRRSVREVLAGFPLAVDGPVHHCGYHHKASFGAASYLIVREQGNVLVDSPRFARPLVDRLEALGGVDVLFLTHRDDVADHADFARHFGCRRVLHAAEISADTQAVEQVLEGTDPIELAPDLLAIPTPGHTEGSTCLLYQDTYLFTGDHMALSRSAGRLTGFRGACWWRWPEVIRSTERLLEHRFEWVLPGHGRRLHLPADEMAAEVRRSVAYMQTL